MTERLWGFLSYLTFFPSIYFALMEEPGSPVRKETDEALFLWLKVIFYWICARLVTWIFLRVFTWEPASVIPTIVLLGGWVYLIQKGLKLLLL